MKTINQEIKEKIEQLYWLDQQEFLTTDELDRYKDTEAELEILKSIVKNNN